MKPTTILLVEDDADLRECLAESLKKNKFDVLIAVSASDAILQMENGTDPDLIISDHVMRDGDGIDLLKYVRNLHPRKPAFFLITGQSKLTAEKALSLGAQEFILKPFNFGELVAAIKKHIGKTSSSLAV